MLVATSGIVGPDAAARCQDDHVLGVEVAADVADVDNLHDHLLAGSRTRRRPCNLEALAAVGAGETDGETVGCVVAEGKRLVVVAQEGGAFLAAGLRVECVLNCDVMVVDVADAQLTTTAWLACIPCSSDG